MTNPIAAALTPAMVPTRRSARCPPLRLLGKGPAGLRLIRA